MSNSGGNTGRDVRKFCRENGIKPSLENVHRLGKEFRRTAQDNERMDRMHKQAGTGKLRDEKGDVHSRVKAQVEHEMRNRNR